MTCFIQPQRNNFIRNNPFIQSAFLSCNLETSLQSLHQSKMIRLTANSSIRQKQCLANFLNLFDIYLCTVMCCVKWKYLLYIGRELKHVQTWKQEDCQAEIWNFAVLQEHQIWKVLHTVWHEEGEACNVNMMQCGFRCLPFKFL